MCGMTTAGGNVVIVKIDLTLTLTSNCRADSKPDSRPHHHSPYRRQVADLKVK